jgi:hypothetical protein
LESERVGLAARIAVAHELEHLTFESVDALLNPGDEQ